MEQQAKPRPFPADGRSALSGTAGQLALLMALVCGGCARASRVGVRELPHMALGCRLTATARRLVAPAPSTPTPTHLQAQTRTPTHLQACQAALALSIELFQRQYPCTGWDRVGQPANCTTARSTSFPWVPSSQAAALVLKHSSTAPFTVDQVRGWRWGAHVLAYAPACACVHLCRVTAAVR